MTSRHIEQIPITQIRVVNPRSRNKVTFRGIINNIDTVGLKKPITVFRRKMEADGTQYDLVCGQGRLEAVAALGGSRVPAILTSASLKERYLMSLIENVARKRPASSQLLREVRELKARGDTNGVIAEKLGMESKYVSGIVRLLNRGEDRLVEQVEAGTVPLGVAVKIATAGADEVQRALAEAYEKGALRGERLRSVQSLIARRSAKERTGSQAEPELPVTGKDLAKEYERHTQRQRALVRRAGVVNERLTLLSVALKRLLEDPHFVALLRAESLDSMPEQLALRVRARGEA